MKVVLTFTTLLICVSLFGQEDTLNSYAVHVNPTLVEKPPLKLRHEYGSFSLSTNLTALIRTQPYNNRLTIEPEYQFTERISLKLPVVVGLLRTRNVGQRSVVSGDRYIYSNENIDYSTTPQIARMPRAWHTEDIIIQAGLCPKYYFNKKSKNLLSFYGSAAFNVGLADQYTYTEYHRLDTVGYYDYNEGAFVTGWVADEKEGEYAHNEFFFFSHEILLGLDYNFSRRITCTVEMGYASVLYGRPQREDQVYTAIFNEDDVLNYEGDLHVSGRRSSPFRARLLLTYRF